MKKVIIVVMILAIYYIFKKIKKTHHSLFLGTGIHIDKVTSDYANSIPSCNIANPKLDGKFTYGFWMYIKDFYFNSECNCWKHIFHKGTDMEHHDVITYKDSEWDSLTHDVSEQGIGLWLSPDVNNLRIVFNLDNNNNSIVEMKYIDIVDVPIKELFHITISINHNFIEVYMNGNLYLSKQFEKNIVYNRKNLFFSNQHTYRGSMYNFTYLPRLIKTNEITYLYENKPKL